MWTRLMGLAVALVAGAVVINALAFSTATVTNATTFTVSSTNTAAIGITAAAFPGSGFSTSFTNNYLELAITNNMQPNSVYKFSNVLTVTNNTDTAATVNYSLTSPPTGVTVRLLEAGTSTELTNKALAGAAAVTVDVEITLSTATTTGAKSMDLVISATQ
jgi:hypothetical protein